LPDGKRGNQEHLNASQVNANTFELGGGEGEGRARASHPKKGKSYGRGERKMKGVLKFNLKKKWSSLFPSRERVEREKDFWRSLPRKEGGGEAN